MQALRRVSALLILLLMVGTLLCRFILPPIEDAREREKYGMPEKEPSVSTNFIR